MRTVRYDEQTEIEIPISLIEPENGVSSGVSYKVLGRGMVPLYEEHEARLERGIRLHEWTHMELLEKALIIANRRVRIAQSNLQADAEIRAAKRKGKQAKK